MATVGRQIHPCHKRKRTHVDYGMRVGAWRVTRDYGKNSFLYFTISGCPDFGPFPMPFSVKEPMKEIKVTGEVRRQPDGKVMSIAPRTARRSGALEALEVQSGGSTFLRGA